VGADSAENIEPGDTAEVTGANSMADDHGDTPTTARDDSTPGSFSPTVTAPTVVTGEQFASLAADRAASRESVMNQSRGPLLGGISAVVVTVFLGSILTQAIVGEAQFRLPFVTAVLTAVLITPMLVFVARMAQNRAIHSGTVELANQRNLAQEARRRELESSLARGLDMAGSEEEVLVVVERAFDALVPERPVELLLADSSRAHLERKLGAGPDGGAHCPVSTPEECVATRHARTSVFSDSEALDACPKLVDRTDSACSAICVPVSVMGRAVGVVHAIGPKGEPRGTAIENLQTIANQAGTRLGMIRLMSETTVQATTDPLTGFLNRRSLENRVRTLTRAGTGFTLVMADLDRFKLLNDRHGHSTGDRALRQFCEALRTCVRPEDLLGRYGGEEFVVVLPSCAPHTAAAVMDRVREELARRVERGDVPVFTASFGVASDDEEPFEDIVQRADDALLSAKRAGRDRVLVYGEHETPMGTVAALPASDRTRSADAG